MTGTGHSGERSQRTFIGKHIVAATTLSYFVTLYCGRRSYHFWGKRETSMLYRQNPKLYNAAATPRTQQHNLFLPILREM